MHSNELRFLQSLQNRMPSVSSINVCQCPAAVFVVCSFSLARCWTMKWLKYFLYFCPVFTVVVWAWQLNPPYLLLCRNCIYYFWAFIVIVPFAVVPTIKTNGLVIQTYFFFLWKNKRSHKKLQHSSMKSKCVFNVLLKLIHWIYTDLLNPINLALIDQPPIFKE